MKNSGNVPFVLLVFAPDVSGLKMDHNARHGIALVLEDVLVINLAETCLRSVS